MDDWLQWPAKSLQELAAPVAEAWGEALRAVGATLSPDIQLALPEATLRPVAAAAAALVEASFDAIVAEVEASGRTPRHPLTLEHSGRKVVMDSLFHPKSYQRIQRDWALLCLLQRLEEGDELWVVGDGALSAREQAALSFVAHSGSCTIEALLASFVPHVEEAALRSMVQAMVFRGFLAWGPQGLTVQTRGPRPRPHRGTSR
jgi:hypothetical protein